MYVERQTEKRKGGEDMCVKVKEKIPGSGVEGKIRKVLL
jgi:hypothetical protein